MREILGEIAPLYREGQRFAVATVVRTWSSAPRPIGASMAVTSDGRAIGSVSGGCVEGAVYEVCQEVLASGQPQLVTYGVSDDDAYSVGLTCGGTIQLYVSAVDRVSDPGVGWALSAEASGDAVAIVTAVSTGQRMVVSEIDSEGTLGSPRLDNAVVDGVRGMLEHGTTGFLRLGADGERRHDDLAVFVESWARPPRMLIFGAIDFAAALAQAGKFIGYHVTVCDARPVFATRQRFPEVDDLVVEWPHTFLARTVVDERTVICVLTHDPKFDVPLLELALRTPAAYVGAMGSRRTHDDRMTRLRAAGMSESELARLHSPIGLDIGARTPQETAVSITAEIVSTVWGGTGRRLTELDAPIHRAPLASDL